MHLIVLRIMVIDFFLLALIPSCISIFSYSGIKSRMSQVLYSDYFNSNAYSWHKLKSDFFNSGTHLTVVFLSAKTVHHSISNYKPTFVQDLSMFNSLSSVSYASSVSSPYFTAVFLSPTTMHNSVSSAYSDSVKHLSTPYLTAATMHNSVSQTDYSVSYNNYCLSKLNYAEPSLEPSLELFPESMISFETLLSLSGLTESVLDESAQQSVAIATANSANISIEFVSFLQQTLKNVNSFAKTIQSQTYDIDATTQLNVPVSGSPDSLYLILTTNIANSVGNGDFNAFLMSASIALNSTSTQNAVSKGVSWTPMVLIVASPAPTFMPSPATTLIPSPAPSPAPSHAASLGRNTKDYNANSEKILFIVVVFSVISVFLVSAYLKAKSKRRELIILDIESI